jgi:hypothetical protein
MNCQSAIFSHPIFDTESLVLPRRPGHGSHPDGRIEIFQSSAGRRLAGTDVMTSFGIYTKIFCHLKTAINFFLFFKNL